MPPFALSKRFVSAGLHKLVYTSPTEVRASRTICATFLLKNSAPGKVVLQLCKEARMLQILLENAMREKRLSAREAAEEIKVSHTTILRALKGEAVDVETIIKFANFLNIRPSELLNSMATDT